jgi:hypothetical protein
VLRVLDAALVAALVLGGLRLRPARALLLLASVVVLLPASLQLPNGFTPLPTATRLTAIAVAVGLLRRGGRLHFRATPLHRAAGVYAGTALVTGVLLAPASLPIGTTTSAWLSLLDPLLVGLVGMACVRAAGPQAALRALAAVALLAVVAGVVEHVTGAALSRLLVRSDPLETRLGSTRIRVGSDFALAFAWTLAALVPAVIAALRRRAALTVLAVMACLAVEYWTFSRSVPIGLAVGVLLVLLGLRDRRLTAVVLVAVVSLGAVSLASPALRARFGASVDQGALDVRAERAPVVLRAASDRPVAGLGLGGVAQLRIGETDEAFLLGYAELGVPGVVTLVVLLLGGLVLCGRGLRGPPCAGRATVAAALAGAAVLIVGGAAFDAFTVRGSAALLGLLLGIGAAAAELVAGPAPIARPLRDAVQLRIAVVGLAVAFGVVLAWQWPTHQALTAQFATLSPSALTPNFDQVDQGRRLIATVCAVAEVPRPRVRIDCVDSNTAAGVGALRLEASSPGELFAELTQLVAEVRTRTPVTTMTVSVDHDLLQNVPTAVGTAPWSLGIVALLLALLVPTEPLRRLQARTRSWTWAMEGRDLSPGQSRVGRT